MEIATAADCRPRREITWTGIIVHHTGAEGLKTDEPSSWEKLFQGLKNYLTVKDAAYVSAHFLVARSGVVVRLVDPDKFEAFHAGVSNFWHPYKRKMMSDWNRYAIGIEVVGDGNQYEYTPAQYDALAVLASDLMKQYPTIHPLCIVGHENIAPTRKVDPGVKFDWHRFMKHVYAILQNQIPKES